MTKYAIKSIHTGKYLSHLFEDNHTKTFQATEPRKGDCHFWDIRAVAEDVARQEDGEVITFDGFPRGSTNS